MRKNILKDGECTECGNTEGEHRRSCTYFTTGARFCDLSMGAKAAHVEVKFREKVIANSRLKPGMFVTAETTYRYVVTSEQLRLIENYDADRGRPTGYPLRELLCLNGYCESARYDGVIGLIDENTILITLEEKHNCQSVKMLIEDIVADYIKEATKFYKSK